MYIYIYIFPIIAFENICRKCKIVLDDPYLGPTYPNVLLNKSKQNNANKKDNAYCENPREFKSIGYITTHYANFLKSLN